MLCIRAEIVSKIANFPLFGVKIVGTGAYIFYKTERQSSIGDNDITARSIWRQKEGFVAKIAQGFVVAELYSRIFVLGGVKEQSLSV